jgi:hypothetical protein
LEHLGHIIEYVFFYHFHNGFSQSMFLTKFNSQFLRVIIFVNGELDLFSTKIDGHHQEFLSLVIG